MKNMKLSPVLPFMSVLLLSLSMLIMSTQGVSKELILGLFIVVFSFCLLCAITLRNIKQIPNIDRNEKVLDIIFSTFELHAHKLPDDEEFEIRQEITPRKNGKVDSFEIHL